MSKKNIFAKFQDYVNKPKRNVFDLSFGNNLTTKFGQLTPVFCKECIPGDSFKIHSRFALQFMPMKFPIQTPMRAYLHFFYVRNRTLWKDWMDFIGKTKDNLTLPYVTPPDKKQFYRVGGLADYLGVPNVFYGDYGAVREYDYDISPYSDGDYLVDLDSNESSLDGNAVLYSFTDLPGGELTTGSVPYIPFINKFAKPSIVPSRNFYTDNNINSQPTSANIESYLSNNDFDDVFVDKSQLTTYFPTSNSANNLKMFKYYGDLPMSKISANVPINVDLDMNQVYKLPGSGWLFQSQSFGGDYTNTTPITFTMPLYILVRFPDSWKCIRKDVQFVTDDIIYNFKSAHGSFVFTEADLLYLNALGKKDAYICSFGSTTIFVRADSLNNYSVLGGYICDNVTSMKFSFDTFDHYPYVPIIDDDIFNSTPYDSDIHLNALPFRAYEAIYNSYYRNAQNNPFILDGTPEYNKYITTNEGGADVTQYELFQRNWEYDFLTSAVQTPQQGDIAPLVGISVTGEATFQDENGNTYYASAQYDSDGNITGWTSHSPDMPQGSLRLLMDMAGTGISINDLRNVNSFQKFLENNIRHGLKYRDQIKSHFGVNVRYDELDMPEFIGGCSTDVNINKLSQTSESGDTPLGSFVGQASAYGESKHDITHYCDEHGFIIGILSVVPVPVYSQLLPKYFVKNEQLDYYFPEFGHLGYQPILQKEVSPLQTYYAGDNLNAVFGYNRAWYDYLDSTDEVHAQFRTTMRDFIMNRTFDVAPELGEDFLLVDPDQLNDVFLAGNDENDIYAPEADKIIGSMYFNVSKKSPIPLFGIPKLD